MTFSHRCGLPRNGFTGWKGTAYLQHTISFATARKVPPICICYYKPWLAVMHHWSQKYEYLNTVCFHYPTINRSPQWPLKFKRSALWFTVHPCALLYSSLQLEFKGMGFDARSFSFKHFLHGQTSVCQYLWTMWTCGSFASPSSKYT